MDFCAKTDVGKVRQSNQDNYFCEKLYENVYLFVVCDGMGGTKGGNIASELATEVFKEYVIKEIAKTENKKGIPSSRKINFKELLTIAAAKANTAVYEKAMSDSELAQMGTTLVGCIVFEDKVYTVNVGDSRLYRITSSSDEAIRITHDHSYVQALVDMGQLTPEEAAVNPRRNILTMAVGTEETVQPDINSFKPEKGDYILLCSDGLYNYFKPSELKDTVWDHEDETLEQKTELLINYALESGGRDNITAILAEY